MKYYPKCFESKEQFEAWVVMAERSKLENPRLSFCSDCSVNYQKKMMEQGKCEHPETEFRTVITEDGEVEDIGYNGWNKELSE